MWTGRGLELNGEVIHLKLLFNDGASKAKSLVKSRSCNEIQT